MTNKDDEQELPMIAARAAEIKAGLDAAYSVEELRRPLSTRSVHALIAGVTASTAAKLKALSARVEAIEENGIRYLGNYQRASCYAKGDTVTHSGSLWVALKTVAEGTTPGSDPACWQLASKGDRPVKRTPPESSST
ncbi:transposase [Rhizobium ruizarguesonis]|uniref:transposase n=1 Tax=Rhizobium TaxID=379 RepID=UPI0010300018|nr:MULTISPECIES: transposase [Rhizobium]MBY5488683.1 transposase [Rhizobium leguminosarum]TBB46305.1 transposase [Rhizobium ruizarguesonis]